MHMEMTAICRTILTAALIALLVGPSGCATSGTADAPPSITSKAAAGPRAAPTGLPQLLGVAVLQGNNGVLCTSGQGPRPGKKITIVLPDSSKTLTALVLAGDAALQGSRACYMDEAAKATLTKLAFEGRKDSMPAVGIGVLRTGLKLDGEAKVDLDADKMKESFKACTSSEGVHLTVWTGEPQKGIRRWHAYYYVDYDTEATCTAGET
jgi:hypothetical protein